MRPALLSNMLERRRLILMILDRFLKSRLNMLNEKNMFFYLDFSGRDVEA